MANANVINVTDATFDAEVIKSDKPVLVDFWAPWCGPCVQLGPVIDQIADATVGRAKVAKVNIDDNAEIAARYRIRAIPALLLFKGGEVAEQLSTRSKSDIVAKLEALA
ncbi:MAG: thioredoxin [Verrucomicrobia bacterium]|nr:MAG: thioredoxin [Verrucomicrobiota bacterium]